MKFPKGCFLLNKGNEWLPTQLQHGDLLFRDTMYRFGIRRDGRVIHANVHENPGDTYAHPQVRTFECFKSLCSLIGYASGLKPHSRDNGNHLYECPLEGAPEDCNGLFQSSDIFELDESDGKLRVIRDGALLRALDQLSFQMKIPGAALRPVCALIGNAAQLTVANATFGGISRCTLVTPNDLADVA